MVAIHWKRVIFHLAAWLLIIVLMIGVTANFFAMRFAVGKISIAFFFAGALFYINYFLLIPKYYDKRNFLAYLLYSVLIVLFISSARYFFEEIVLAKYAEIPRPLLPRFVFVRYIISSFSAFVLGFLFWMADNWKKRENAYHKLKALQHETEVKILKNQLQPHFLFNAINNIYSLAVDKDERIPELLLEISDLLRYLIYKTHMTRIPLKDEVHFLNVLIKLYSLRYAYVPFNEIKVVGEDLNREIAPLLLLPFIENIFKHGDFERGDGFWRVELHIKSGILHFYIQNPMSQKSNNTETPSGIGLTNVKQRLVLIYPEKHSLSIKDTGDIYNVELMIDLNE